MVVFTLGSDSGFGIGHDGIVDDYDDDGGISVILWCIIFVFLLIVTIWFYITQLMPNKTAKCEIDEDDEDERVANRLLDQLGVKIAEKPYDEFQTCAPSTSSENAGEYEVIDGEIRINYTSYERDPGSNGNNGEPRETNNILRRPSMEEMSLIFPGFLPSISEEEEEGEDEECLEYKADENVYKSSNDGGDNVESNVNIFIEPGFSMGSNNLNPDDKKTQLKTCNGAAIRVTSNRKGKQPVAIATTELRRRNFHNEFTETQAASTTQANRDNENYVGDNQRDSAVAVTYSESDAQQIERTLHTKQNTKHVNFISGSGNYDPAVQNTECNTSSFPDPLIIADESTVALETLSLDANENTGGLNLKSNDNLAISATAKSSCIDKENVDRDAACVRKSSEILQGANPVVSEDETRYKNHSQDNDLDSSNSADSTKSSTNMTDQLTHAWTFYAMSDETTNYTTSIQEGGDQPNDQQPEIPQIIVDFYQDEKQRTGNGVNEENESWMQENESMDTFETDIDVDDVELDELDNGSQGRFNCFFKRHVSVTDLDKIISSHEIPNDSAKQYEDELNKEKDLDEIVRGITEPVGRINKQVFSELKSSTGDQKTVKELESNATTGELVSKKNIKLDQVSNDTENTNSGTFNGKLIKTERTIQLTTKQQIPNAESICSAAENTELELKLGNHNERDPLEQNVDRKQLEMRSQVENYVNTSYKSSDIEIQTKKTPTESRNRIKTAATELKDDVYCYKTNTEDIAVVQGTRSMNSEVVNSSHLSFVDLSHSNVTNSENNNSEFILSKDERIKDETKKPDGNKSAKRSFKKGASTESKVGLTAEELSSKIDLTRPIYAKSRDEVIIGKKKNRKDSGSRSYMNITSRNTEDTEKTVVAIGTKEDDVTQSSETKEPEGKKDIHKNKTDDFTMKKNINPTFKETIQLEQDSKSLDIDESKETDPKYHVEKREIQQQPTIKRSVVLIPEKNQLQTLITIKDIPDTSLGVEISTNRPFEVTKQKKISTGLERAEQIVARRLKRLEDARVDGKVQEDITCTTSNSRQIDWNNFLVDGLSLKEANTKNKEANTKNKDNHFVDDDILLPPQPPAAKLRKTIHLENKIKVTECFTSESLCPGEIDWQWLETEEKHAGEDYKHKPSPSFVDCTEAEGKDNCNYDVNDNVQQGTDMIPDGVCPKIEHHASEQKNNTKYAVNNEQNVVVVTDSSKDKDKHDSKTTGEKMKEFPIATKTIQDFSDDNDVFSNASYPSSEPEFPVRLTKSFSELRNIEMLSQSVVENSNFNRPDRSKSQTDVFEPQGSQDSEEHVFNTKITMEEVYKNKRRIVILNVRKKSPGKARWKSLSDLESARKHVMRFSSIGSHPEENVSAGDSLPLSPTENKETVFSVSGRDPASLSTDGLHNNDAVFHTMSLPTSKQAANQTMEGNFNSESQYSDLKPIEQSSQKDDTPLKVSNDDSKPTSPTFNEVQLETVEPKLCSSVESQSNVFQDDPILNEEKNSSNFSSSPTDAEIEMCLPREASRSPVKDLTKQDSSRSSPGRVFAVSSHSPTPPVDTDIEKSALERKSSLSPVQVLTEQDPVCSSGTMFAVSRHSPIPPRDSESEKPLQRESLSPVKDMTTNVSRRSSSPGTVFSVSRFSPTPLRDSETKVEAIELNKENSSPESAFAASINSPSPMADPEIERFLQRQSSLSPVKDIAKQRSPSGTMFAVSRHSPTPSRDSKVEKSMPRQSSLSPVQDVVRGGSSRGSGRMFAVSRHSPTPLSNSEQNKDSKPTSPVLVGTATTDSSTSSKVLVESRKSTISDFQRKDDGEKRWLNEDVQEKGPAKQESRLSQRSITRVGSQSKREDKGRPLQRELSLSPELKHASQDSSSRRSSASSGYGGSRISPTSSVDWRQKPSKPSLSPELVPDENREASSRRSSASSRISPTPSTDSEYSNIDERKPLSSKHRSQRGSHRSGRVFAISGYSSAASDTDSQRAGSVSPRDHEPKLPVKKEKELQATREVNREETKHKSYERNLKEHIPREQNIERSHRETNKLQEKLKVSSSVMSRKEQISDGKLAKAEDTQVRTSAMSRSLSAGTETAFRITRDGWLINSMGKNNSSRTNDHESPTGDRVVVVTDLDSLLYGPNSTTIDNKTSSDKKPLHEVREPFEAKASLETSPATKITPSGVQETNLDDIFTDSSESSSSKEEKNDGTMHSTKSSNVDIVQRSRIFVTSTTTTANKHIVQIKSQEAVVSNASPSDEGPVFDDLDEEVFTKFTTKPIPKGRDRNDASFSSDADSETSSLSSVPLKTKNRHTKTSLAVAKSSFERSSRSSESSSATPSTPEKGDPEFLFLHPDLTSTPEKIKTVEIAKATYSMPREAAKEPRHEMRQDNAEGNSLLTDSSYGAAQVKMRSNSECRTISTEIQRSAFTPVRSRTKDHRSISQEYILDGLTAEQETPPKGSLTSSALEDHPTFREMADSHKSMPDLHKAHENNEVHSSPEKTVPYHSRLSAHTRLWLSQTAGIDTSNLCKDESVGSEIFLFPSNRFQPGKNVDASFLSIASDNEDIPDDVSTRPSSPMSEFSFAGEAPFAGQFDDELNIVVCGHRLCGREEVIRGQEKTSFTSCPSCYTYYCSRECRQAHWREHKKSCHFGRINSYMRSFIYFCHKRENLKLLLSNIATKNYASKGRGCVMVTFASPKQARKFMTSGCVLLPSPPSYPTVRELMREGVVSKHKVNLVQQVKDYNPTREFVLNLAVVAGKLEDLPRNPVPRHKLGTVLQCIKIPLSESVIEPPKSTVPSTSKETRVFYLPKCARHEFINDMEARRHYCRNISKGLKSYGIRLKKDYPEAYESLCLYVENNVPFKPLTVYGNQGSKIIACKIMPEASISAV